MQQLSQDLIIADRFELVRMNGRAAMEGEIRRKAQAAAQLRSSHVVYTFHHDLWQGGHPSIAIERRSGATTTHVAAAPVASKEKPINLGF